MHKLLLPIALMLGLAIAYIDSRPTWDDAGVTALAIVLSCALCAALAQSRPWLYALAIGTWIPLVGVITASNYGSLLVLPFSFAGAFAGVALRNAIRSA